MTHPFDEYSGSWVIVHTVTSCVSHMNWKKEIYKKISCFSCKLIKLFIKQTTSWSALGRGAYRSLCGVGAILVSSSRTMKRNWGEGEISARPTRVTQPWQPYLLLWFIYLVYRFVYLVLGFINFVYLVFGGLIYLEAGSIYLALWHLVCSLDSFTL